MKYYGEINNPKDLVTKEYVDNTAGPPFIISDVPPNDKNKLWIYNGTVYYYDADNSCWKGTMTRMDSDSVSSPSGSGFEYKSYCPFVISSNPLTDKNKLWIKDGSMYYYDYSKQAWVSTLFTTDVGVVSV